MTAFTPANSAVGDTFTGQDTEMRGVSAGVNANFLKAANNKLAEILEGAARKASAARQNGPPRASRRGWLGRAIQLTKNDARVLVGTAGHLRARQARAATSLSVLRHA